MPPSAGSGLTDPLLYPAAPITLVDAVAAMRAGTGMPVKAATWGLGDVGIVFAGWLTLSLAAGIALVAVPKDATSAVTGLATVLAVMLPWLALAGWPLLVTKMRGNGPRIDLGLRWSWRDVGWGVLYGIAAFITAILLGMVTNLIFGNFDSAAGELGKDLSQNAIILILFSLTVSFGAPIVEEIFFRGLTFGALAKRGLAPWLTVLLSALVFGLFHLEPVRILVLTGIGLVLGLARWHTGSTTTAIVAHMINNLPGAIGLLLLLN
ncbi:MAG: CPBP family intramembrane glutamic endopeptidase [Candidatus Nanopelagicales bacterium]